MSYLTLVTGGARSGKSSFAERQLIKNKEVCYIATGISSPEDQEMQDRIKQHQKQRPVEWQTHEAFLNLASFLNAQTTPKNYLFDCATLFTTNYFFYLLEKELKVTPSEFDQAIEELSMDDFRLFEGLIMSEWETIIRSLQASAGESAYIVTNEIGLGLVPETKFGRLFRDLLGRVNQFLAKEADAVYFVISGLPQKIK